MMPLARYTTTRAADALCLAALAIAACVAVFQVVLLGKLPDHYDFWLQEYVHLDVLHRALRGGELPLWNPYLVGGTPHLADPQSAALYPFTTLPLLLLGPAQVARLSIPLHYLLAGAGTYWLARALGQTRLAALGAGFAYSLAPHFAPLELPTYLQQAGAWAPLISWALLEAFKRRSLGWFAASGALWGLQLLRGYPQTWYFTGLFLAGQGAYLLVRGWRDREMHGSGRLRLPVGLGVFLVVALALAAGQLLPSLELLGLSHRSESVGLAEAAGRGRVSLYTLLGAAGPDAEVSGAFPGGVTLGLALAAVLFARGTHLRFFALTGVVGIALALGSATPLWGAAYTWLPGFQLWHMPHRALFLWSLCLALLAGWGLDALRTHPPARPLIVTAAGIAGAVWLALVTAGDAPPDARGGALHLALGVGLVCAWVAGARLTLYPPPSPPPDALRAHPASAQFSAEGKGSLGRGAQLWATWAPALLIFLVPLDPLAHTLPRLHGRFYPPAAVYAPPEAARWLQSQVDGPSGVRFASEQYGEPRDGRGDPKMQDNRRIAYLPPNVSALFPGLDAAQGYLAIRLERSGAFFDALNDLGSTPRLLSIYDPRSRLLDLFGVRYFVTDDVDTFPSVVGGGASLTRMDPPATMTVRPALPATQLELTSSLGDSLDVADGEEIGRLTLTYASGGAESISIRAGDHTAEWMYDAPAVAGRVRHRKAPLASSDGRSLVYRAVFELSDSAVQPARPVSSIRLEATRSGVRWNVYQVLVRTPLAARFRLAHRAEGLRIWENPAALPLAWWVPGFIHADAGAAIQAIQSGRTDPRTEVFLDEIVPEVNRVGAPTNATGSSVIVLGRSTNRLTLDVSAPTNGLVVINQTDAPGWQARVDGQLARVRTANTIQQAIYVPAGRHTIELFYLPGSVVLGLSLSGATAAVLAAWGLMAGRRANRSARRGETTRPGHAVGTDGGEARRTDAAPRLRSAPPPSFASADPAPATAAHGHRTTER